VLAAPIIRFSAEACEPTPQGRCAVLVVHSSVPGAVGYIMVSGAKVKEPCNALLGNSCVAVFASAPGCGTVLKAVDARGNEGPPSTSFCVPRGDAS
jgi:hypothetical protein